LTRVIILAAAAAALWIAAPAGAQAAFTCSQDLGTPIYHTIGASLQEGWQAQCYGAQWKAEFGVQYKVNGEWQTAGCANTNPCYIRRPSQAGTWYSNGTFDQGRVYFAVLNQCVTYRVRLTLTSKGGVELGPYPSPQSVCE